MDSTDLSNRFPKKPAIGVLLAAFLGMTVFAAAVFIFYPRYQARQWEEELVTTVDDLQLLQLVQKILRSNNTHADAMLVDHCNRVKDAVFSQQHRVVLLVSDDTGRTRSATRWSTSTFDPDITARFVRPQIVENVPEAVTIAVTNYVNKLRCLFVFSYRHTGHVCDLSDEEFETWRQDGFWNRYVFEHGDPIADVRDSWTDNEEEDFQQWKTSMEEKLARPLPETK